METLGRYQLIRKLATGGMAEVFLATAEGPGGFSKELVVKRILPHFADNPQFVEMFLSEAKLAAQLNHPNIVQVFDFGETDGHYYLAMEYVDGVNLRTLNKQHREGFGPIPPAACARIISQACEGLAYAHAFKDPVTKRPVNLVHRDISPDNLIISKHGAVKVLDFGIAKAETQVHKTSTGMLKGKMAYMPQEQLQREVLDQRVDVYALGVVLFELLAGSMPFDATSEVSIIQAVMKPEPLPPLSQVVPGTSPLLDAAVAKALAKSRNFRYSDTKSLQNDLETFVVSTGEKWLPSDLAELVLRVEKPETLEEASTAITKSQSKVQSKLSSKTSSKATPGPVVPAAANDSTFVAQNVGPSGTGISSTSLRQVEEAKPKGGSSAAGIVIALALVVIAAAASAFVFLGRSSGNGTGPVVANGNGNTDNPIVVPPPPQKAVDVKPTVAGSTDAGGETVAANAAATPVGDHPEAADTAVVNPPPTNDTAPGPASHHGKPEKNPSAHGGKGEVDVRVRPYATLFVDGAKIGDTPLDQPLALSAGKHTFRLVNEKYSKDVEVEYVVKPGKSVFKYNLME